LGLWVILAAACGSNDESASELWCDGVCTAAARCGFQASTCSTSCAQQNPQLSARSASGAAAEKPCLEKLSCQAIGGDDAAWKEEQNACWDQAIMAVAVSDRARRFCPDYALAWFECGYSLSLDDCEHIFSMWSDAVVDRLALCNAKESCDELESCEKAIFDDL
jgi:hypothetical protein